MSPPTIWTRVLLVGLAALFAAPAQAAVRNFSAGSLVIPMDTVYQTNPWGLFAAYGFVYRMLQRGITVYLIIDPNKKAINATDMSVTKPGDVPVAKVDWATLSTSTLGLPLNKISFNGAPFVIGAADVPRVMAYMAIDPAFAAGSKYRDAPVQMYVARESFNAPVAMTMSGQPPRISINALPGAMDEKLMQYLTDAGLNEPGDGGVYGTSVGQVWDRFNDCGDYMGGGLVNGRYGLLWSTKWPGTGCADTPNMFRTIATFIDQGGGYFAESDSIATGEKFLDGSYQIIGPGQGSDILKDGVPAGLYPVRYADYSSPYVQVGDLPVIGSGAQYRNWLPARNFRYRDGTVRLVQQQSPTTGEWWDFETYIRKDNDPKKGPIIYMGGNSYSGPNGAAGERMILNTMLVQGFDLPTLPPVEVTRSAPIDLDGAMLIGTFMATPMSPPKYPPVDGHLRLYAPGALNGANVTAFKDRPVVWDAATLMPAAADRKIFTVLIDPLGAAKQLDFNAANAAALAAPMGVASDAAAAYVIDAIRAGGLGGIDRSIPAVAGPSEVAGSPTRPKVAYVGGLDGMLHAIGISGAGVVPGREMWAFVPPSQLDKIGRFEAGVDGSPQITDAFVDDGTGRNVWRTLLAVTCRDFGGTVTVLDVTDPWAPRHLWTGATPVGPYAMGQASGAAFGRIRTAKGPATAVFVATHNAGTGGSGVNLYALDAANGALIWQFNRTFTRYIPQLVKGPRIPVPNDTPAIPALASLTGEGGLEDRLYFGDLEGRLWEIDAATGKSTYGNWPMLDFGEGRPLGASVALARDPDTGNLLVIAVTGGADWVDPSAWTMLATHDVTRKALRSVTYLGQGERVYSAPTVSGNDVYILTSFGGLDAALTGATKDKGNIRRINLSSGAITYTATVEKGAAQVAVTGDGAVVAASTDGLTRIDNGGRDVRSAGMETRFRPFTVQAWLDLR